ncbi:hypothetical protein P4V41_07570 [Fictibacillus nanhaiensis]|uniref:hypothetical protein n=1 Tax=Fictibacillus nanhaiensis TaxID=742169 RepID=UPI002E1C5CE7|nr:hypothetical protein [Fictibacillus nanhaiensis]
MKPLEEQLKDMIDFLKEQSKKSKDFSKGLLEVGDEINAQFHDGVGVGIAQVVHELECIVKDQESK